MNAFERYLAEAFPPPKGKPAAGKPKPAGGPPKPGGKPGTPKPGAAGGGKPPFGGKPPMGEEPDATGLPGMDAGMDGGMGEGSAMMAMQVAQAEQEQQAMELRQQKEAEEAAEREKIKKMRMKADSEVMDDLADKYDEDDTVEFYPSFTESFIRKLDEGISVSVRPVTYRGKDGFSVTSKSGGAFGTKIFTNSRAKADRIADAIKAGKREDIDKILLGKD